MWILWFVWVSESESSEQGSNVRGSMIPFINMPLDWFLTALALPGKASGVATLIWHQVELTGCEMPVVLSAALLEDGELDRHTVARNLHALEKAGLIQTAWRRGAKPRITLTEYWLKTYQTMHQKGRG
jgi:hypothetical protein